VFFFNDERRVVERCPLCRVLYRDPQSSLVEGHGEDPATPGSMLSEGGQGEVIRRQFSIVSA